MDLEQRQELAHALLAALGRTMPRQGQSAGSLDDWNVYVPATVARCAYFLESIMVLSDRQIDGMILLRSVYEHVVTFAWIAIDPSEHMPAFVANEFEQKLLVNRELSTLDKKPFIADDRKKFFENYLRGATSKRPPDLRSRADAADRYWSRFLGLTEVGTRYSFLGLYSLCFRHFSAYCHPSTQGLEPFVSVTSNTFTIHRPRSLESCLGIATLLFSDLLLMTASILPWPDAKEINDIYKRLVVLDEAQNHP